MTQTIVSTEVSGQRDAAPAGLLRTLPWIFAGLGMLAPLALVAVAAVGSDDSAVRAQMIVQGCQLLVVGLMATAVLGLLYALGMREAARVTAPSRTQLRNSAA